VKFFAHDWQASEGADELVVRYREQHLPAILPRLPHGLAEFARGSSSAGEPLGIHDALVRRVVIGIPAARLGLELRAGDLAQGYADLDLEFRGVDLMRLDRRAWEHLAREPRTELLYDEIDLEPDGRCVWRVLVWPKAELEIVFREFAWRRAPQPNREFTRAPDPYVEHS